jgi:hypothetical protein
VAGVVERGFEVRVQRPPPLGPGARHGPEDGRDGVMAAAPGPEAVAPRLEPRTFFRSPACDAAKIRCRSRRTSLPAWSQSMPYQSRASFGPFTTVPAAASAATAVMASNLPPGSGACRIVSPQTHLTRVGALSGPGTRPGIRPVTRDGQRRSQPYRPGFPWPFGPPSLASRVILSRRGIVPSSRSADQAAAWTPTGFPRSARVRHDRGGCPLDPGAVVLTRSLANP